MPGRGQVPKRGGEEWIVRVPNRATTVTTAFTLVPHCAEAADWQASHQRSSDTTDECNDDHLYIKSFNNTNLN